MRLISAIAAVGIIVLSIVLAAAVTVISREFAKQQRSINTLAKALTEARAREVATQARLRKLAKHSKAVAADADIAHNRLDNLKWQFDIVIKTCPGRAHAPTSPEQIKSETRPEVPRIGY